MQPMKAWRSPDVFLPMSRLLALVPLCLLHAHGLAEEPTLAEPLLPALDETAAEAFNESEEAAPVVDEDREWDVVVLRNGQRLEGTIETLPDPAATQLVLITKGGGRLGLPASAVAHVRPGLDSRMEQVETLDRDELLSLARHCLIADRKADAKRCLELADAHKPLQLIQLRLLARLTDEIAGGKLAMPLYQRCNALGDSDSTIVGRLSELREAERAWLRAKAAVLAQANNLGPVRDGLEVNPNWRPESPKYSNPAVVEQVQQENGSRVNRMLRFDFEGGKEYKAVMLINKVIRLGDRHRLIMWVHNADLENLGLSIAVKTGKDYDYFESKPYRVPQSKRWSQVSFDLQATDFKSATTNWKHSTTVDNLQDIRELQLQVHNQNRSGSLLIDGIGFHGLSGTDLSEL